MQSTPPTGWWRLRSHISRLRALAIVVPVAFFILIDAMQHNVGADFWHSWSGIVLEQAVVIAMIAGFAFAIFGVVERAERAEARQSAQIAALQELSASVSEGLDLEAILATGLQRILDSTRADAGVVCHVRPEEGALRHLCKQGLGPELVLNQPNALANDPVASMVVERGQSVLWADHAHDPTVQVAMEREGLRSGISVPLWSGSELNGILAVGYRTEHEIGDAERDFLESAGRQLGLVVHNASLYEEALRQGRELATVVEVATAVASAVDLNEVLDRALDVLSGLEHLDGGEVWLVESGELRLHEHRAGDVDRGEGGVVVGAPRSVAEEVAAAGRALWVDDPAAEPRLGGSEFVARGYQSLAAIPIQYGREVLGVLVVASESPEGVRESGQRQLTAVAEQMAPALANARLHQQLQDEAVLSEREWISREMHDGLAQVLGYVNTQVLAVRKLMERGDLERSDVELSKLSSAAREAYSDVREGILALRVAPTSGAGVLAAIQEYTARFSEMSGMKVATNIAPGVGTVRLSPTAEIQLIRIVQEALSNARRHSGADAVTITVRDEHGCLLVDVSDSGCGFDMTASDPGGATRFGLQTMRERAEDIGGSFDIESAPGAGTSVRVRIPEESV